MATAVYSEPDQMLRSAPSTSRTNKGSLKEVKNVLLSIHLDALLDFVDEQANKQLWKLFSTCAGSIAHGRRLENLSWRTWGREQSALRRQSEPSNSVQLVNPYSVESPLQTERSSTASANMHPCSSSSRSIATEHSKTKNSPNAGPCYSRLDSNASTPSASGTIAVPPSPPLGYLIKRVIFTPPDPTRDAFELYAAAITKDQTRDPERLAKTRSLPPYQNEIRDNQPSSSVSEPTAAVATPYINPDSHVLGATPRVQTPISQVGGPRISTTTCTGDEPPSQRAATSTFPTVVISLSTPKPTPPDTPARCLSPTVFQALTPLNALTPTHAPSPTSSATPSHTVAISTSPRSPLDSHDAPPTTSSSATASPSPAPMTALNAAQTPTGEPFSGLRSNSMANSLAKPFLPTDKPVPVTDIIDHRDVTRSSEPPNAVTSTSRSGSAGTPAANRVPISTVPSQGVSHQRMFFLQRDSNSFSPDSNSRSYSHSRSPTSPTHPHRRDRNTRSSEDARSSLSGSRSPVSRKGVGLGTPAFYSGRDDRVEVDPVGAKVGSAGHHAGMKPPDSPCTVQSKGTAIGSRSSQNGTSDSGQRSESRGPIRMDQAVQVLNDPAPQSSYSPHGSSVSTRSHRLMTRSRRPHRSHLARALDRQSSRPRGAYRASEGSVGSRASMVGGSLDGNVGSASVSGMGSVSTSSSSKLVMGKSNRTHSSPQKPSAKENIPKKPRNPRHWSSSPAARQSQAHPLQQVSPLAVLPEPMRMEVLERQVVESTIKRQSGGGQRRTIALVSDSEDDESFDEEEDGSDEHHDAKAASRTRQEEEVQEIVDENDNSSWSDEETGDEAEEVVVVPTKRMQTAEPAPLIQQQESREQKHAEPDGAAHQTVRFQQGRTSAQLPHVKSKARITQPHRASPPPPAHQPPVRKSAAAAVAQAHGRTSQSSGDLLAQASREARRQLDMFTPLPRESWSSTNLVREKSLTSLSRGGRPSNLTLLLNPDPRWFPQGHPYRETKARDPVDQKFSRSMEEIYGRNNGQKSPRPGVGLGFGGLRMTSTTSNAPQPTRRDSAPARAVAAAAAAATTTIARPNRAPPPTAGPAPSARPKSTLTSPTKEPSKPSPPPLKLRASKSTMAVPVVFGVTASSAPRDEQKGDALEISLRQMGARQQRQPRYANEPSRSLARLSVHSSDRSADSRQTVNSARGNRLGARPDDVELSESDSDEASPPPKDQEASGRSLAKEHLEAVIGGRDTQAVKAGLNASRSIVASPDSPALSTLQPVEATSYRPPAPPSSPSIYDPEEEKRTTGGLRQLPPGRSNRPRPHSSHGLPPVAPNPGPSRPMPQRERRPQATSQPPAPVSTEPPPSEAPFPYNLPYPAPPQSPRTTRLKMLATEVPDDLRKDLLWERKTNRIAPPMMNSFQRGPHRPPTTLHPGEGNSVPLESEQAQQERLERERQVRERYERMRTKTWNGVIFQRPVW